MFTPHALVVGNAAGQIGWACTCGERLTDELEYLSCGKKFSQKDDGLLEKGGLPQVINHPRFAGGRGVPWFPFLSLCGFGEVLISG